MNYSTAQTIMEGNKGCESGAKENTLGEWSDGDDDWIWDVNENTSWEWSGSDDWIWDAEENVQTGRGKKRKSTKTDEGVSTSVLPEENFYVIENVKQVKSKKFQTTAMNYSVRFNNTGHDLDLIESYERTQGIFEHLLNDSFILQPTTAALYIHPNLQLPMLNLFTYIYIAIIMMLLLPCPVSWVTPIFVISANSLTIKPLITFVQGCVRHAAHTIAL